MTDLAEFTAPIPPDTFLSTYWTRRAVYLHDPKRSFDPYFGWEALNTILNSGELVYPDTAVRRKDRLVPASEYTKGGDGKHIDPAALMRLVQDGAGFSIRGADGLWPPLRAVKTSVYDAVYEPVHTNMYYSPADQGSRCHYDLHEVFVLQIAGAKRWKVFEPTTPYPVEPWREEDAPGASATPYLDATLRAGDVLYVPRGHWHDVLAEDSASLHITIGIVCRKADALLDWLGRELQASVVWRQNVPLMGAGTADGQLPVTPDVKRWIDGVRQVMLDTLRDPDVYERFLADMFAQTTPVVPVGLSDEGVVSPSIEGRTLRRPAGQRHIVAQGPDNSVVLKVGGAEMALEGVPPQLLARILAAPSVTVRDLEAWAPTLAPAERTELLESLVQLGLLV